MLQMHPHARRDLARLCSMESFFFLVTTILYYYAHLLRAFYSGDLNVFPPKRDVKDVGGYLYQTHFGYFLAKKKEATFLC